MKLMIVDDEVIIRTGLARVIPWRELGFELLEPAASAEEALERLPAERPDLLLTDIRMTGASGLELAAQARAMLPDLEVIILTGYDDFAYARQALREKVADYLLKTSTPEEIIRTMLQAKERFKARHLAKSRVERAETDAKTRQLIGWVAEGIGAMADPSLLPDREGPWQVLLVQSSGWGTTERDRELLGYAVHNALRELLPGESFAYGGTIVLIQQASRSDHDSSLRRQAARRLEETLGCRIAMVGGEPVLRPAQLHRSYVTARDALAYRQLVGRSTWEYAEIAGRSGGKSICSLEDEQTLIQLLLAGGEGALREWTVSYVHGLLQDPDMTPASMTAALQSVAVAAFRWLERMERAAGLEPDSAAAERALPAYHPADGEEEDQIGALYGYLSAVMESHRRRLRDNRLSHVAKAKAYIEENLGGAVSLQQVADYVHLHPNHLSELFKRETGMRFVDYVTTEKMRRAAEALSTPAKIADIAASVGYGDVKYFGKLFKKHTGYSPAEYRNLMRRQLAGGPGRGTMKDGKTDEDRMHERKMDEG